jgi:hypothetical protein
MKIRSVINFSTSEKWTIGINVSLKDSQKIEFAYCVLLENKGVFNTFDFKFGIQQWDDLIDCIFLILEKNPRIHINIEGTGIFTKTIELNDEISEDYLKRLFPGFKANEFVLQIFTGSTSKFLSLLRNDSLHSIKNIWTFASTIQSGSLGFFVSHKWKEEKTQNEFIEEEETLRMAYFAAKSVHSPDTSLEFFGVTQLRKNKQTYDQVKIAFYHGRLAIIALLLVVLCNLVIFSSLRENVANLESKVQFQRGNFEKTRHEENSTVKAQQLYKRIGWPLNKAPLYFADQIGKSLSGSIHLRSLEIGTLDRLIWQNEKKFSFEPSKIRISGDTMSAAELGNWLQALRSLSWVKDIVEQRYHHNEQTNIANFEFVIVAKGI